MTAQLDPLSIARIRKLAGEGRMLKDIAKQFGVTPSMVSRVCKDVPKPFNHRGAAFRKKCQLPWLQWMADEAADWWK